MALVDEYESLVRSGKNPAYANYLAQIIAASGGININSNQVSAAPASLLPDNSPAAAGGQGFWGGLQSGINNILGSIDDIDPTAPGGAKAGPLKGLNKIVGNVADVVSGTSAAVKFITNIPRVATTVLGLILIIAGIFALARGPAVQIVSSTIKEAVTS